MLSSPLLATHPDDGADAITMHSSPQIAAHPDDGAHATVQSVLGVGERLAIRIDARREEVPPGVPGQDSARSASAIRIIIDHLGDVRAPVSQPTIGHLQRRANPGRQMPPSDADLENLQQILDTKPKTLQAELQGIFKILVLVTGAFVPVVLVAYTILPADVPFAKRTAWITLCVVLGLVVIAAVISRLGRTEAAAEVSSVIGLLSTIALIVISEVMLAMCLPDEKWTILLGGLICFVLLIGDTYAWTECAGRPKCLRNSIRACLNCFKHCISELRSVFCTCLSCWGCR